jgi:hypothetical protein
VQLVLVFGCRTLAGFKGADFLQRVPNSRIHRKPAVPNAAEPERPYYDDEVELNEVTATRSRIVIPGKIRTLENRKGAAPQFSSFGRFPYGLPLTSITDC